VSEIRKHEIVRLVAEILVPADASLEEAGAWLLDLMGGDVLGAGALRGLPALVFSLRVEPTGDKAIVESSEPWRDAQLRRGGMVHTYRRVRA